MEIYKQLAEVQKEVGAIGKTQKNDFNDYMFRGIDDFYNYFHKLFRDHQILILPEVLSMEHEVLSKGDKYKTKVFYNVKYTYLSLKDGSSVYVTMAGEGDDSGDKSTGKAMSNSFKYALAETFIVPTKDIKDSDQFESKPEPKQQPKKEQTFDRQKAIDAIEDEMQKVAMIMGDRDIVRQDFVKAKTRNDFMEILAQVKLYKED